MIVLLLSVGLLAFFGALVALVGLLVLGRNAGFNRRAVRVEGRVVGHREHFGTAQAIHRRIYFPTVRYTLPGGPVLEASAPGASVPPSVGATVELLVDPEHPEQVSFTGPRGRAGVAVALAGVGVGLVLLAILAAACLVMFFAF